MPFDFSRQSDDPGLVLLPELLAASGAITAPRPRRRIGWIGWTDRAASFAVGALGGVLLAAWLLMGIGR